MDSLDLYLMLASKYRASVLKEQAVPFHDITCSWNKYKACVSAH